MRECPNCYLANAVEARFCEQCGYRLKNHFHFEKYHKPKSEPNWSEPDESHRQLPSIAFECYSCFSRFRIVLHKRFDGFACELCRSIYTYELSSNEEVVIETVRLCKAVPSHLSPYLNVLGIDISNFDRKTLKGKYAHLLSMYHPDKVDHMADEFKVLAEEKTREINEAYAALRTYFDQNE